MPGFVKIFFVVCLVSAIGFFSCSTAPVTPYNPNKPIKFHSVKGNYYTIGKPMEKPMVVVFFATWCPGCKHVFPAFKDLMAQEDRSKFDLVAIGREHDASELLEWSDTEDYGFDPVADPDRDIFSKFAEKTIPRIYIFDTEGKIHYETIGWSHQKDSVFLEALHDLI